MILLLSSIVTTDKRVSSVNVYRRFYESAQFSRKPAVSDPLTSMSKRDHLASEEITEIGARINGQKFSSLKNSRN